MTLSPFKETHENHVSLSSVLRSDGYLFFRGILDTNKVKNLRNDFISILSKYNLTTSTSETTWTGKIPDPETSSNLAIEASELKSMRELANSEEIIGIIRRIYGDPIHVFEEMIPRAQIPQDSAFRTVPHQDIYFFEKSTDFVSAWIPLINIDSSMGGLTLASNTHHIDLDKGLVAYGTKEGSRVTPGIPEEKLGDVTWLNSNFRIGDLLLFTCKTIHKALPNTSNKLRISIDTRYQNSLSQMDWRAKTTFRANAFYVGKILQSLVDAEGLTGVSAQKVIWESLHGMSTSEDLVAIKKRIEKAKITNDAVPK